MSKSINTFTGNIVADLDVSKIKPDQIVFPTVGVRVFNKNGQGLIATILPGNIEYFSLTDGFVMLGGVEYEGVGYIFSLNESTGEGEVGTYPSPNMTSAGFTRVYKPLMVFDPSGIVDAPTFGIQSLRTTRFNFSIHHPVDVVAKKSYDNSVDLYFIDFYNPDRVINNGFKITGESVHRYVYDTNFDGAINHIPFTKQEIKVQSLTVSKGGYFKPGNVFLYIRYLTADYAKTDFVKEIGVISMSFGDTQFSHVGFQEKDWTTDIENVTDKKIDLVLADLDENFAYFQIAVVRYSATTENGPAQRDIWLIDNYYPIGGTTKSFSIYGNEAQESLLYTEILKAPFPYPISKTQVQLDKRLLKANVKRSALDYKREDLITFAKNIVVGEFYYDGDFATKPFTYFNGDNDLLFYSKADDVYNYLGYFKEQIYPFVVIFKLSDGTLSEAFPVTGNLHQTEEKGLYQFGSWQTACGATPNQNRVTGVSFNVGAVDVNHNARQFYADHKSSFNAVVGFYFARADRIDNLLCQGVMMRGYYGVKIHVQYGGSDTPYTKFCSFKGEVLIDPDESAAYTTTDNNAGAAIMPLFRGYMPTSHQRDTIDPYYYGYTDDNNSPISPKPPYYVNCLEYAWQGYDSYNPSIDRPFLTLPPRFYLDSNHWGQFEASPNAWDNKHGLFSPDLLFDNGGIVIPGNSYVKPIFTFKAPYTDPISKQSSIGLQPYMINSIRKILPSDIGIDLNQSIGMDYLTFEDDPSQYVQVRSTKVGHLQGKGELNFAGYFSSEGADQGFDVLSNVWNRDIGTCGYVGIEDTSIYKTLQKLYAPFIKGQKPDPYDPCTEMMSIVNLYKSEIDASFQKAINDSFIISATQYGIISDLVSFDDINTVDTWQYYKGDCFLQKVWFRTHRWYAMAHNNDTGVQGSGQKNAFGLAYIDPNFNWYQYGFMVGMTVECRYNAGMRNEVVGANADNKYLKYTFFPKAMQDGIDKDQWIVTEPGRYGEEALQINAGYDKVLSDKTFKGYDFTQPIFEQNKPNRVYASDAHIAGSFLDGYRSIQDNSYQDFMIEDGDINYIGKNLSYAFIVQRNGINQIFINERSLGATDEGQEVIMGTSLTFFSDKVEKLAWFGTQHKLSIVNGTKGTYGFDFLQGIWWMIDTFRLQSGMSKLRAEDLTEVQLITDEIKKMLDGYSTERDVSDDLVDDPLSGSGIVGFADMDNEEVGMTFLFPRTGLNTGFTLSRTIVFSEKIGGFRGDYPFSEPIYFNIGNMLLSPKHYLDDAFIFRIGSKMYLYNQKVKADGSPNYNIFFGNQQQAKLSFIVNGLAEKENTSAIEKIFNAMELEMKHVNLKEIIFTTQYQTGTYDFATSEIWKSAEYLGHKWHVPITVQTSADKDQFLSASEMNGVWMKVTLVYESNEDIELKEVETDFDLVNN